MRAIRQYEFGPPTTLRYEEVPDPEPGADQVRIDVAAAGVHLVDTSLRRGQAGGAFTLPELPTTPGREVAGTVDTVGPGVDERWVGRRVVAHLGMGGGGYAERAVALVGALHAIPEHLSPPDAVAMIGTGRTAVGVLERAALAPDDVVLVTSAAGGLGTLFVQAVHNVGAVAVGVAGGPAKVARVRDLGAEVAVDYQEPGWPDEVRRALGQEQVSVVLDGVGGAIGRAALELLRPGGRLVMFGFSSGRPTDVTLQDMMDRSLTVTWALGRPLLDDLRRLETLALEEAAAGHLVPRVTTFPLADAAAAHAALESRGTTGKVVLLP
jgi:NADPH2:quinone reductase